MESKAVGFDPLLKAYGFGLQFPIVLRIILAQTQVSSGGSGAHP